MLETKQIKPKITVADIATPDENKTDVTPGINLYEDDSMLIILLPYKSVRGHNSEQKIANKAYAKKRWQFWSNYDGKLGVYLIMIK